MRYPYYNWTTCQFFGVKARAANLACPNTKTYTLAEFLAQYPQFTKKPQDPNNPPPSPEPILPEAIMQMFIDIANSSVSECVYGARWMLAIGLYTAHLITLYLMSYQDGVDTPGESAMAGMAAGFAKSATLGDASISYDNTALVSGTEDWGTLNATIYGQQYANMARIAGLAGSYII